MHSLYKGKYARIESMENNCRTRMNAYDAMSPYERKQARKEEL